LPGKQIHVLETTHLGPRKAVHLVKIGEQQLLIGSTNESITTLADVTGALTEFSAQQIEESVTA
jgi:flagellar biogenesis protein FliO